MQAGQADLVIWIACTVLSLLVAMLQSSHTAVCMQNGLPQQGHNTAVSGGMARKYKVTQDRQTLAEWLQEEIG